MRRVRAVALPFSVRLGGPHPLNFGVGRRWLLQLSREAARGLSDDARLFATAMPQASRRQPVHRLAQA
jgi:hypothetical protein